ncbi:hypothetical protein CO058_02625 [candidate division WWE3 bacterium CG_4_9_14_0_2_um_filter_35_11]|uniref:Tagatose-bisphosphate aldolase n=1 Tax=candidate division WWE3 bacterium CG_4_9_14_0_2_um_filter_35_11 TaxID=1975077 RepID=A0A2M8ELL1_UNCKA|nr:MAG: hypothetical protein COV25_02885 [candidate division WWE3 bacterium CG10_big_fil_rev_8_21_14_0_10_35_32]PJC23629.1 MAG: hypothetical protein CO058_02625 [candidate division WWE3 bacterium CG_4_9_14_0_2_um_filter_35_11]
MELSSIANTNGYIKIAAFDHRSSLVKLITEEKMSEFKVLCAQLFSPYSTAILVDPEYGKEAITIAKNNNIGVLLSREQSVSGDDTEERRIFLSEKYTASRLKSLGATAIKLFFYYNRDASNSLEKINIIKALHEETKNADLPLLIEPVTYAVDGYAYHRGDATLRAVKDFCGHCDILKLEYPIDPEIEGVRSAIPYLNQISEEIDIPWVLLSRGMKFENYKKALILAKEAGCSGFAVGRAVWQEFANFDSWEDKVKFMETIAVNRMKEISEIWN